MAELNKLTGHGAPSVLLPGAKGQIYEDLDTGRLYECKGERGFIRVDGDDQDNQFNWVLKGVDISYNDLQDKPEQGGGVSSWNDLTDKPFYESVLTSIQHPDAPGLFWYKVSDDIPTGDVSERTECTLFFDGVANYGYITLVETDYYAASESLSIVILNDNTTIPEINITFPEKGTYFMAGETLGINITGFSIGKASVPEITWDGQTTKLKKLDQKFIPSRIIGVINHDLTFTADPSFDPATMSVFDALSSGMDLLYKTLESDEDTLKCIAWRECTGSIGFHDILDGRVHKLIWTVLTDGTVSIENTSVVS